MKRARIEIRITEEQKQSLIKYCTDKGTNITTLLCTYIDKCTDKVESVRTPIKVETKPIEQPQTTKLDFSGMTISQIKRAKSLNQM